MNRQRFLLHAMLVLTLARYLLLASTDLSPVEAETALSSERAVWWHALSGPVLPVLMKPGLLMFGMNEWGVRWLAPLLMLAAGWMVWRVASGLFDGAVAGWAALFFQVTPMVNFASVTMTNTTLGIFFSASLLALLRLALHRTHRFHLHWWAVAVTGVLAFLTDWRLGALSIGGAASLTLTRRGRHAMMKWPVLPILGGTFALTLTLFLAWNSEHGWSAFHFFPDTSQSHLGTLLWRLLLAFGPLLPVFAWTLVETALQRPLTYVPAFLYAFTWPLLALDMLAFHTMDWPQCGFGAWLPPVVMLAALHVLHSEHVSPRTGVWLRSLILGFTALQSIALLKNGTSSLAADSNLHGWRVSANEIRQALEHEHLLDGRPLHFMADDWQLAAPLSFYLHDLSTTRTSRSFPLIQAAPNGAGRSPEASWMRPPKDAVLLPHPHDTVIYITDEEHRHQPRRDLREKRPGWRAIAIFQAAHQGLTQRTLKVFACPPESAAHK